MNHACTNQGDSAMYAHYDDDNDEGKISLSQIWK